MADALTAKEKGNAAFRAGKWHESIGHYSAAIFADRANPTYPLNRAAAYLKVGKNEDAERDCTTVLDIDQKNVKAMYRRAQAREALGKRVEAQLDLAEALRLDPTNATVKADLERLRLQHDAPPPSGPSGKTSPASSTPRRKRIPIAIVDEPSGSSLPPTPIISRESKGKARELHTNQAPNSILGQAASANDKTNVPSAAVVSNAATESFMNPVTTRRFSPSDPALAQPPSILKKSLPETKVQPAVTQQPPRSANGGIFKPTTTASPSVSLGIPEDEVASSARKTRPAPATLFDFSKEWNASASTAEKWEILRSIPPSAVKSLFGKSLTTPLLLGMVDVVQSTLDSSLLVPNVSSDTVTPAARTFVTALPSVDRFSMLTMLMTTGEKQRVSQLLKTLGVAKGAWGL